MTQREYNGLLVDMLILKRAVADFIQEGNIPGLPPLDDLSAGMDILEGKNGKLSLWVNWKSKSGQSSESNNFEIPFRSIKKYLE